jgi:hypothetical protein
VFTSADVLKNVIFTGLSLEASLPEHDENNIEIITITKIVAKNLPRFIVTS